MHHAVGVFAIVAAIGFAFGERTARFVVGASLLVMLAGSLYVGFLIVMRAI